jgi:oligopeptide transport system permease protein
MLYSAMLVVVILIVDILYGIVDPRIRVSEGSRS